MNRKHKSDELSIAKATLIIANKELVFQHEEKEQRAAELLIANKELVFQHEEKEQRAAELLIANKELVFQNEEKEKRAAELLIANKELVFQNEEKEKRAAELLIANKELVFQHEEKDKRAAELLIANKELAFQNKELEQFAYVVSHDLQEPLRTIISFAGLISEEYKGKLDEDADKYIGFLLQSSIRMQTLVKGLLDYSRIGKEKELTLVDCNRVIHEVLSDLTVSIKESGAQITILNIPELYCYSTEIRQLFQNLICNALKFRKKDVAPEIKVSAHKQADGWLFSIQDNGIGIDENDKDKIFIIFKRLHNRNEYEGTGIGLSLCKKIVELHGGNIFVKSKPGKGSIFNFTIPKL